MLVVSEKWDLLSPFLSSFGGGLLPSTAEHPSMLPGQSCALPGCPAVGLSLFLQTAVFARRASPPRREASQKSVKGSRPGDPPSSPFCSWV